MAVMEKVIEVVCFISILRYSKTSPCNNRMCLTWKVNVQQLTLMCKVNNLHLRVLIGDPFGNIQADCLPLTSNSICDSFYRNGTIIQNRMTNETIYIVKGKIDRHINGNWTCRHGTRREVARVEVTVLKEIQTDTYYINGLQNTTYNKKESDFVCLKNTAFYTIVTLLASVSISLSILSCLKSSPRIIEGLLSKSNVRSCTLQTKPISRSVSVCKKICFLISIATFIGVSILISWLHDKICTLQWVFIVPGSIFGIVITILFLNREEIVADQTENTETVAMIEHL